MAIDSYLDDDGNERCDDCEETLEDCACTCIVTGDPVHECAGPGCEHDEHGEDADDDTDEDG